MRTAAKPQRVLVAWLVLLPFFVYVASVGSLSLFLGLPTAILVAVMLIAATDGMPLIARPSFPGLLFGGLVAFTGISAAFAQHPLAAQTRVVYLVAFGLFGWAVARAVATGLVSHKHVASAITWSAAVASVALIMQFIAQYALGREHILDRLFSVQGLFAGDRAARADLSNWVLPDPILIGDELVRAVFPFMSPASAGQYLMLGLLAAVWLLLEKRGLESRREFVLSWSIAALIGVALFLTFSRQAWIGALFGLALMIRNRRRGVLLIAGTVSLIVAASFLRVPGSDRTFMEYFVLGRDVAGSLESGAGRIDIWEKVPHEVAKSPVIGVGPGQYRTLADEPDGVYYAHNVILDSLVELGIIGAGLTVAFLVVVLKTAWRQSPRLGLPLLAAWLVANMVDDTLYFPRNGFVLAAIVALSSVELSSSGVEATSAKARRSTALPDAGPSTLRSDGPARERFARQSKGRDR